MAVVVGLAGGVDADHGVELDLLAVLLGRRDRAPCAASCPSLSAVDAGDVERLGAVEARATRRSRPAGNCSGSTPMPIRFERWIRS